MNELQTFLDFFLSYILRICKYNFSWCKISSVTYPNSVLLQKTAVSKFKFDATVTKET